MPTQTLGNAAALLLASQMTQAKGQEATEAAPPIVAIPQIPRGIRTNRSIFWTGLGVAALGTIGFLVTRRILRGFWFNVTVDKIDDPDKGAYYANPIYNAIHTDAPFGWGTDESLIRDTILEVPHRVIWERVKNAYESLAKKHGRTGTLMNDLRRDLTTDEFSEINAIIQMMPANQREADNRDPFAVTGQMLEQWAKRINAGAQYENLWFFGGTDEAAIYKVLEELPTLDAFCQLNREYPRHNDERLNLIEELIDELDSSELRKVYTILIDKPDATPSKIQAIYANGCR